MTRAREWIAAAFGALLVLFFATERGLAEFRVNTNTPGDQVPAQVASLENGGFIVVWHSSFASGSNVSGQRFDATGARVGSEFKITPDTDTTTYSPSVVGLTGGGFVVTWNSLGGPRADGTYFVRGFGQLYDSAGVPTGTNFKITPPDPNGRDISAGSPVALRNGGFVVNWAGERTGAWANIYTAAGTLVRSFRLTRGFYGFSLFALTHAGFLSLLQSSSSGQPIYGQRYSLNGRTEGSQFTIGYQGYFPSVASLQDGGFVLVWRPGDPDSPSEDIWGQRYDSSANLVGAQFKINKTPVPGLRAQPVVSALKSGGFVVVWQAVGQNGSDVFAQRFDRTSARVGGAIRLNAAGFVGDDSYPWVAGLTGGGFAATWESGDSGSPGDGIDIYGDVVR